MFDFAISTKFESSRYGHSNDKCLKKLINGGKIMSYESNSFLVFVIELRKLHCLIENNYNEVDSESLKNQMDALNRAFYKLEDE